MYVHWGTNVGLIQPVLFGKTIVYADFENSLLRLGRPLVGIVIITAAKDEVRRSSMKSDHMGRRSEEGRMTGER